MSRTLAADASFILVLPCSYLSITRLLTPDNSANFFRDIPAARLSVSNRVGFGFFEPRIRYLLSFLRRAKCPGAFIILLRAYFVITKVPRTGNPVWKFYPAQLAGISD